MVMENILYLDHPWISVYTDVIDNETCDKFVNKYTELGMNPNAGLESREQTYGQITEEVEQRSISWDTSSEDRQFFRDKICEVLKIPDSYIEAGDIYRYDTGQYFGLHHDFPYTPEDIAYYAKGGDRKATAIFWLNDGYDGGECKFPELGVCVTPEKGGMMYFEYDYEDEKINKMTIHEGMPITKGAKWIAAFFIANGPRVE
jgi:prolyl 4-hydroxylase|tara:strand:- start:692 stop:1297 length:606 start_codon:yes stop_codon:yes gene_type:complete